MIGDGEADFALLGLSAGVFDGWLAPGGQMTHYDRLSYEISSLEPHVQILSCGHSGEGWREYEGCWAVGAPQMTKIGAHRVRGNGGLNLPYTRDGIRL